VDKGKSLKEIRRGNNDIYVKVTPFDVDTDKTTAFYNRQNVRRSVLPRTIYDVIYHGGQDSASDEKNTIIKNFTPVASITAPPGISKIRYLYVLATQTVAHVFHILVPRG
jgi:hypothetical protein